MFDLKVDDSGAGTLVLSGDLTIQFAKELKQVFVEALEKAKQVTLQFDDVDRIDLAGLQVLCAAHRSMSSDGVVLTIGGEVPEAVREAVTAAGFQNCVPNDDQSGLWTGGN